MLRIGGKLRRVRQERHLNQVRMAAELGISPSYLNLMESNQRPVTARVLVRLAERFQLDLSSFAESDQGQAETDLMEVFSDPVFEAADVKTSDLRDLVATLPSVARSLMLLYRAYRTRSGGDAAGEGADLGEGHAMPSEEVADFIQRRANHFPVLEEAAEALWREHGLALHTLTQDLMALLQRRFSVAAEIAEAAAMPGLLRSYDPMTRRLVLSEMLPLPSRTFQLAHQIAILGLGAEIESVVAEGGFTTDGAATLARVALANYFAGCVLMPYRQFLKSAQTTRYDIDVLQHRFGVSFEQACHRLTTLRRPGHEGIAFHLLRVDIAGNISKRFSASGIHIARFGAACPRWNVYDAFATPGMLRVAVSRMPDGQTFFCVARTVRPAGRQVLRGALSQRAGELSIGLGCALRDAREIAYADGLHLEDPQIVVPIGVSCRTCPRNDCTDRAVPSFSNAMQVDENRRGLSTYVTPGR